MTKLRVAFRYLTEVPTSQVPMRHYRQIEAGLTFAITEHADIHE
jgi:hypothetical protein